VSLYPGVSRLAEHSATRATRQDNAERIVNKAQAFLDYKDVVEARRAMTFIEGFEVSINGPDITVGPGAAWVEGREKAVRLEVDSVHGFVPSFTPTGWYQVYLYEDEDGIGRLEVNTSLPASPYLGRARSKDSDWTRRYVDSIYWSILGFFGYPKIFPDGWRYWSVRAGDVNSERNIVTGLSPGHLNAQARPITPGDNVIWMPPTAEYLWINGQIDTGANHNGILNVAGDGDGFLSVGSPVGNNGVIRAGVTPFARRNHFSGMVSIGENGQVLFGFDAAGAELSITWMDVIAYWSGRA
jgi:hypothetical protein